MVIAQYILIVFASTLRTVNSLKFYNHHFETSSGDKYPLTKICNEFMIRNMYRQHFLAALMVLNGTKALFKN